jgi:hypothetical protein
MRFVLLVLLGLGANAFAGSVYNDSDKLSALAVGDLFVFGKTTTVACHNLTGDGDADGDGGPSAGDAIRDAIDQLGKGFSSFSFRAILDADDTPACTRHESSYTAHAGDVYRVKEISNMGGSDFQNVGESPGSQIILTLENTKTHDELVIVMAGPSALGKSPVRDQTFKSLRKSLNWDFWVQRGSSHPAATAESTPVDNGTQAKAVEAPSASDSASGSAQPPATQLPAK